MKNSSDRNEKSKVALVTGGNKGIGFEICKGLAQKGFTVLLGARDAKKGEEAAKKMASPHVQSLKLDVTQDQDIDRAFIFISEKFGRLDVLVNNAGIFIDGARGENPPPSIFKTDMEKIEKTIETNSWAPLKLTQKFVPLMLKNGYGRVVNMSSGMGQLSEMEGFFPAYRISKTILNSITKITAEELKGKPILVNAMCPGWVKTDMGGSEAPRSPEKGAETAIWLSTLAADGPSGGFFKDKEKLQW